MASYRCGVVLAAGLLLTGSGIARAQQPQSSTGPLTYDQMLAQEQQAKAQQEADEAKHGKKKHADGATAATPADAQATPAPAAAATPAAAETAPATPAVSAATAAQGSDAAATPATVAAQPAASGATVEPSSEAPVAAAGADVPPATAAKDSAKDDANFKPVKLGKVKDAKGKSKVKKEKPPKLIPVNIVHGELTVDGLIAKAGLNFQILDLKYLYIWVPGLGTAVISNNPFPGATIEGGALDGNTLTVTVDGHTLQLTCDRPMLVTKDEKREEIKEEKDEAKLKPVKQPKPNKKDKPLAMYVAIDRNWQKPSQYPEFGYGDLQKAPYSWPGTLADLNPNSKAPPLPDNLKQHPESVKLCGKNGDPSTCREVSVPLVLGKDS